jgi:hypothetical protein
MLAATIGGRPGPRPDPWPDEIDQSCVLSYANELNTGIWEREMKVAEALAHRADLQRRLEQLKQRLVKNARVQEGDQPAEVPDELQTEFERCAGELISLIQRINRTNASSRLGIGTLADALAERDVLKIRQAAYRELAAAASTTQVRTTRSEVKFVSTVSVAVIQRKADVLAKDLRELDTRIQEADWQTNLSE